jgi:hypothetical protein
VSACIFFESEAAYVHTVVAMMALGHGADGWSRLALGEQRTLRLAHWQRTNVVFLLLLFALPKNNLPLESHRLGGSVKRGQHDTVSNSDHDTVERTVHKLANAAFELAPTGARIRVADGITVRACIDTGLAV